MQEINSLQEVNIVTHHVLESEFGETILVNGTYEHQSWRVLKIKTQLSDCQCQLLFKRDY